MEATHMTTTQYAPERAEAFAERLVDVLNDAAVALMISVGHRTGLLDALAASGATTSEELAGAAGLEERYVRECLAALTVGGVVEHDAEEGRFFLPPEHAAWLTRESAPNNFAVSMQWLAVLGAVEDDVVRCFREGGGVPYERFDRFHEVMAEESEQTVLARLFSDILPLLPGGLERLEAGVRVLDLGCGRGRALIRMAERFPRSTFVGYDLSAEAIADARAAADELGLRNIELVVRDLRSFDADAEPEAFDIVTTFDAVHDQPWPLVLLRGIRRTLKPGGAYLMQDIDGSSHIHENVGHVMGPFLYTISCMHCMTVSLAQGGEGLGTLWGEQKARALLAEAGFGTVEVNRLEHDIMNAYFVSQP
jgi:ubiquinone/menaquinone biosynthesis C-methylase UbiE